MAPDAAACPKSVPVFNLRQNWELPTRRPAACNRRGVRGCDPVGRDVGPGFLSLLHFPSPADANSAATAWTMRGDPGFNLTLHKELYED